MGRPKFEITEEVCQQAKGHAARGLTQEQIAAALGMGKSTMYEKMKLYPEFLDAIKEGQAEGIGTIANALFERAIGCKVTEERFVKENGRDKVISADKYYPPDTTACIFFLKNRAPSEWKDRVAVEQTDTPTPKSITVTVVDASADTD